MGPEHLHVSADPGVKSPCQNRERTGVPTRAARVGWWKRPDQQVSRELLDHIAIAPDCDTSFDTDSGTPGLEKKRVGASLDKRIPSLVTLTCHNEDRS